MIRPITALLAAALTIATFGATMTSSSSAESTVSLFKVVTVKDEIVIGLPKSEIAGMASQGEEEVATVARAIDASGPFTAWQFAVRKGADGELEQAPLQRVSLLDHDSLRVEPYKTPLRIAAQQ